MYDAPTAAEALDRLLASEPKARTPRRRIEGLSRLLDERADLRGAYAPADYIAEAVRWNA